MSARKFLRIQLVPTTLSALMCIGCGRFNCDYEIVNGDPESPEAGIHKKCIAKVKAKRGAS